MENKDTKQQEIKLEVIKDTNKNELTIVFNLNSKTFELNWNDEKNIVNLQNFYSEIVDLLFNKENVFVNESYDFPLEIIKSEKETVNGIIKELKDQIEKIKNDVSI